MPGLAKEHARRASADLSAWWTNKQQHPQSQPMLARHQSAPQTTPYDVYHPSTKAAPPSNRRQSSETVTASSPTSTPVDPSRAHLHYRDQQQQQFVTAQDVGYGDSEKKNLQEEDELARALEASQRETEAKTSKTAREDEELRAALAESTRLARLNPSLAAQEQADLSKALLASQREVLQGSALSRPPRSSAREQPNGMARSSSSTSLEESEWALRARNEKGSLWNEAGAHGWLPPGASRAGGEDEREMEMLELAIRISLEEEEERKAREAELQAEIDSTARPSLHGQMSDSTHHSSYATAPSVPSDDSAHFSESQRSSTPQTLANSPPKRKLPPPPASHIVTQPLSPPTSPHVGSVEHERDSSAPPLPPNPYYSPTTAHSSQAPPLPSRAPPSPPASELERSPNPSSASQLQPPQAPWTADPERSSSPYEIPFLTSSPSIRRSGAPWQPPSPLVDDESGRFSGASYTSTPSTGSMLSRNSPNFGSDQEDDNRSEEDPLEALTVRNPDASQPPSRDPPPPPPPTTTALPAFESTMTGRSLSLVSEATEPPSPSSAGADSVPSQLFGAERGAASPPVQSPTLMQALQNEPPQFVSPPTEQEIAENRPNEVTTPAAAATELAPPEQTTFGEGVRFGYPRACAHEEDHACSMDGLGSDAPFPSEVVLSSESEGEERSAFSVEARSWAGLLRFLMWYGETTVAASPSDIAASPHRHCDASLSLSFRHDDLGSSILRLTISLLPAHEHSHTPDPELTIASPPLALNNSNGKGKGKARASTSSPSTTFLLPDHLVLPTRLSSTAHTLYSLRHLAQIALSTQPSKHASPSYHALRALAQSIQQLALVSSRAGAGDGRGGLGAGGRGQDDLVGRLRERLKRMRGPKDARGGVGGGGPIRPSTSGAKLVKIPPTEAVARTTAVRRRDRVLSVGESDEMDDAEYAEAREEEAARLREEEQRRREEDRLENETRWLPTLGRS